MSDYSELFRRLATGSDDQIDASLKPALLALADDPNPKSDAVHEVLDQIVHGGLASGFVISVLDYVWTALLTAEGRTKEQAVREKHG